LFAGKLS